jgi:hypothetical protein
VKSQGKNYRKRKGESPMSRTLRLIFSLLLVAASTFSVAQYDSCANYSAQDDPTFWDPSNATGHKAGGYHQWLSTLTGNCTYATVYGANCSNTSYSYGSVSGQDTGYLTLTNPLVNHYLGQTANPGKSIAPLGGATTTSQVTVGVAVESCNIVTGCSVTVTISGGASGVGASVSIPPSSIFGQSAALQTICPNEADPTYGQGGGSGFGGCECDDPECGDPECTLYKKPSTSGANPTAIVNRGDRQP